MNLDLSVPDALQYFSSLVASDEHLPLLEAAASMAQDEYPQLDIQQVLDDVDKLAVRLWRRIDVHAGEMARLRALNQFFFGDLGFAGNVNDYHNPDNSFLHRILHTRMGIPVSLAVLWMELAQGLGLRVDGVGFPAHFLVQVHLAEGLVVLDLLSGRSLNLHDLRERMDDLQLNLAFSRGGDSSLALYLQPLPARHILARMLRNLQEIYRSRQDWARFVTVQNRMLILLPTVWSELRERGLAWARMGELSRASEDLTRYLQEAPEAQDREMVAQQLASLGR